jgi:predicted AlkP superfamily phosphohydrolase/phosphomutase
MEKPQKVVVIGCDAALPKRILKYIDEGALPTFKKLIEEGVIAENALVPHPTITPPNWTTIATGAWPGTHGITDYWVHQPGKPLTMNSVVEGFDRDLCQVENIWEAAEKAGKRSIVYNYPSSWPSRLANGIVVAGNSNIIDDWRSTDRYGFSVCTDAVFCTTLLRAGGVKVALEEAEDWENAPESGGEDLEVELPLPFVQAIEAMKPTTWFGLIQNTDGNGYTKVTVSPTRDCQDAFCTLGVNEWSRKLTTTVETDDGKRKEVTFRIKLLELAPDGTHFKLYMTGLAETSGFSMPPEIAPEISRHSLEGDVGIRGGGLKAFRNGWIDIDTYVEVSDLQNIYLAESVEYLLTNKEWDIFFMHEHTSDWMYHGFFRAMDPVASDNPEDHRRYQDAEKRIYMSIDRMIQRILEAAGENVLTCLISDHGAVASGRSITPMHALAAGGLATLDYSKVDPKAGKVAQAKQVMVDWSKTKAMQQRACHIYVNLKGRDPDGIVEPADYETVRQEIIDCLMMYIDAETGKRPFSLALRREDARPWGIYGELAGDVIYAVEPWVGGEHGNILPTAEWGLGSLKALFVMHGPGIRKNTVLDRTVWITDLVPTICHLMDLPLPSHAEGAILYQAFEDADFKLKEIAVLREQLQMMESKLE